MGQKLIITDWNDTVIKDSNDNAIFWQITWDEFLRCASHKSLMGKAAKLLPAGLKLRSLMKKQKNGHGLQTEIVQSSYDLFNESVLKDVPLENIQKSVSKYAIRAKKPSNTFHMETFNALLRCKTMDNSQIAIVTAACEDGVRAILNIMKSEDYFDFICGSELDKNEDGTALGIRLKNYDDKHSAIVDLFKETEPDTEKTVYLGDDARDAKSFDVLSYRIKRFVVAPGADEKFKEYMSGRYGWKVRTPGPSEKDVYKALTMD